MPKNSTLELKEVENRNFMKVLIAQINPTVGALESNAQKIIAGCERARKEGAEIAVFPELALSGYPPEDLLYNPDFIAAHEPYIEKIKEATASLLLFFGTVRKNPKNGEKFLCNSCCIIGDKKVLDYYDKWLLPTYDVFDERRFFEPGDHLSIIDYKGKKIAVSICEDIWQHRGCVKETNYRNDPVQLLAKNRLDLHINISASPYHRQKKKEREAICASVAKTLGCPVIQCCQVGCNDQIVFDGFSSLTSKEGVLLQGLKGFEEDYALVDTEMVQAKVSQPLHPMQELFSALVLGIRDYFHKQGFKKACLGLSGGIDSALVAVLAKEALGKDNVLCIALPSQYNPKSSLLDAQALCHHLQLDLKVVPIEALFQSYLDTLSPLFAGKGADVTEENLQARIRGTLLMALSNKWGYLLLNTSNKSELAFGYSTLYGDLCGALAVLGDVCKTTLYELAHWINQKEPLIPASILTKAPSAELRPNQKDQDTLPPYPVLDQFIALYLELAKPVSEIVKTMGLSQEEVERFIRSLHLAEYKRRQGPPVIRVTKKSFKVGRNVPIVQRFF